MSTLRSRGRALKPAALFASPAGCCRSAFNGSESFHADCLLLAGILAVPLLLGLLSESPVPFLCTLALAAAALETSVHTAGCTGPCCLPCGP